MRFEWDPKKAQTNWRKHRISFEVAITAFDDPFALIASDTVHSRDEPREWLIGESDDGVLVIVFTEREERSIYRIISARRTTKRERRKYEEHKRISF